jgi:two-component system, cell cycle sensor histidine kinase and response regulator CckA
MMRPPLRALIVEDSEDDVFLLLRELRRVYEVEHDRVQTREDLEQALSRAWDVVFSDFSMPAFDGLSAFRVVRSARPDLPFIVVSGTMGEEIAVTAMREGIDDYILKGNVRMVLPAVERVLALRRERARTRAALQRSEATLAALLSQLPAIVWTTDRDLRLTSASGAVAEELGMSLVGRRIDELPWVADEGSNPVHAHERALAAEGAQRYSVREQGRILDAEVRPLRDEAGNVLGTIGVAIDTTQQRRLEQELRIAKRLEAIGQLAGGVAHDFNNILTVIRTYVGLAIERASDEALRGDLETVQDAAMRAAALTRQLLAVSRRQVMRREVLRVGEVVTDLTRLLTRTLSEDVRLAVHLAKEEPYVEVDRSQLEQVVLNLAVNARDAMPEGGVLSLCTREIEIGPDAAHARLGIEPGKYVELEVSDTGVGMDDETRARIFEPFFTTKGETGTGLGLATVHGIVQQSGGFIVVQSTIGEGTIFKLCFPFAARQVARSLAPQKRAMPGGRTSAVQVLLVEDDDAVRRATRRILERAGYHVTAVDDPERALEVGRGGTAFDLLLTDLVMPGLSGRDLAARMRAQFPNLGVCFMSGYARSSVIERGLIDAGDAFVPKPFGAAELLRTLEDYLSDHDGPHEASQ